MRIVQDTNPLLVDVPGQASDTPVVFLVGCGRSGTTWLQMLLARHPAVASAPETNLFAGYLNLLERRWNLEAQRRREASNTTGIADLISEEEFHNLLKPFARTVLSKILARKPGASLVLEKTPHQVHEAAFILRVLVRARFIHIVRDPRAVCASMLAAARSWGAYWAPRSAIDAARVWRAAVEAGWGIPGLTANCRQVRYEDLLENPTEVLRALFDWLALEVDTDACREFVDACRIERLRTSAAEPQTMGLAPNAQKGSFFRRGSAHGWREELTASDIRLIEYVAGPALERAGYVREYPPHSVKPVRLRLKETIERMGWRADATFQNLKARI